MSEPILVVDEITVKPGGGEAFLAAYLREYAPLAEANGLTLLHRWVDPPVWLDHRPNRLLLVWRAEGPRGLWAAKRAAREDPRIAAWWARADDLVEHRRRSVVAEAESLAGLADV